MTSSITNRAALAAAVLLAASAAAWGQANGNGLIVEHWDNITLSGASVRTDVNFGPFTKDYADGGPNGNNTTTPRDSFSSRYRGLVEGPTSGTVTFEMQSDDAARFYLDGQLLLNHTGVATTSVARTLAAGQKYALMVEHVENTGNAYIHLRWAYAGQANIPIPINYMYSPATIPATPTATPNGGVTPSTVTLATTTGGAQIWYTLDGSDPGVSVTATNPAARLYSTPFTIDSQVRIRARAYIGVDGVPSALLTSNAYMPSFAPLGTVPANLGNLYFRYYHITTTTLPNYEPLIPQRRGLVTTPSIAIPGRDRTDNFGFKYTGYVNIPTTGDWTFQTTSKDGSRLWIGTTLVADNNGVHASATVAGTITLQAGWHPLTITYFESTGASESLGVSFSGPGVALRGLLPSDLATDAITADPTCVPNVSGTFPNSQLVTLSCATGGATIFYTIDGSAPDERSASGTGASGLFFTVTTTTRVRAVAVAPGLLPSGDLCDFTFTRTDPTVSSPLASVLAAGHKNRVEVNFLKTVVNPSASLLANYSLDNGAGPVTAALQPRNNDHKLWLKLDEAAGPTANDSSPAGTNAGTWTSGPAADTTNFAPVAGNTTSLDLPAATGTAYVSIPDAANLDFGDLGGGFTFALWVRPADTTSRRLFNKWDWANDKGWHIDTNAGGAGFIQFRIDDGPRSAILTQSSGLVANVWQHITCRFDRLNYRISVFRNGVLQGTADVDPNFTNPDSDVPLLLGRLNDNLGNPSNPLFTGQVDDVRIFGVALTNAEIAGLAAGAVDPSTRVVLTTNDLTANAPTYALSVNNVIDASGASNSGAMSFIYKTGAITEESYYNIGGGAVTDLTRNANFPASPTIGSLPTSANVIQTGNAGSPVLTNIDNYGRRVRGYFIPDTTGDWVFAISTDDGGALWLSTDEDPSRRRRISYLNNWAPITAFKSDPDILQSGPNDPASNPADTNNLQLTIPLVAGNRYYIEGFMKEGGGGDHLSIAAKLSTAAPAGLPIPDSFAPIPALMLAPYLEPTRILTQPVAGRVVEAGQSVTLTASATGSGATYQWRKGVADIVGQTSSTLTLNNVTSADAATYTVRITDLSGATTLSSNAVVTVITPPAPTISAITPVFGPSYGEQTVKVTGTNLLYGRSSLSLGGSQAGTEFWTGTGTTLFARTTRHAVGTVDAVVSHAGGTGTLANGYTYYDIPTLTQVSPVAGDADGTTVVTLTGSSFHAGTQVFFDGVLAGTITPAASGLTLTCVAPAHAAGASAIDVKVVNSLGSATMAGSFTYYADPTILTIDPPNGPVAGGPPAGFAAITITGANFLQGLTSVTFTGFGTVPATVTGPGTLTVSPPAGTGTVNVFVIAPGGTSAAATYTYYPIPTLGSLSQNSGLDEGGDVLTLTGTGFVDGFTTVFFGATGVTPLTVPLSTSLTVSTPAGTGTVNVTVRTPGGTTTPALTFTYVVNPTVSSVTNQDNTSFLNNGRSIGGNNVRIMGTNFVTPLTVTFDGQTATSIVLTGTTQIDCVSPVGLAGSRVVAVGTPGGTANGAWIYHDAPTVTSVSNPSNTGSTQGGETRTVNGSNLPATFTVITFGGTPATGVVASGASADVTTPAHAPGQVDVVVTTPGGTATLVNGYTYTGPFVSGISPNVGPVIGGQTAIISGSGLSGATSVTIGGATAAITGNTAGQITVTTPPGTAGAAVDVVVTTPSGTFTLAGAYSYTGTPTITSVTPNKGPAAGGQNVQIIGTNFASGFTEVRIGGTLATGVSVTGTTQIDLVTPPGTPGAPVNVVVTTYTTQNSAPGSYEYFAPTTVSSIVLTRGPLAGGRTVTITGTNFVSGQTQVLFGAVPANPASIAVDGTGTSLTATTPAGAAAGLVTVFVRTFDLAVQQSQLTNGYTYVDQTTAVDLSLTKTVNNGSATVGQNVIFTITLSNTGAVAGTGVVVTDLLPAALTYVSHTAPVGTYIPGTGAWSVPTIAATSGTAVLTVTATVNSAVTATNVAEVTATTQQDVDSDPTNSSPTEDDRATATVDSGLTVVTPAALQDGTSEAYYYATIAASGGTTPYTWSLVTSTPAFPFNLDPATGVISGFAPTLAVTTDYVFTLQVTDSSPTPQTNTRQFTISIDPETLVAPVINASPTAPAAVVGQPYFFVFTGTGGNAPYVWTSTALPAGLVLNSSTGALAGAPTTPGTPSFSVTATSSTGASVALVVNLTIAANPVTITTTTLPNGTVGALYTHYVELSGGIGPFNWTVSGGALPGWMSMTNTGRRITLSGTPNNTTAAAFTLQAADVGQGINDTQAYAFTVAAAGGAITVSTPANGLPDGTVNSPTYAATLSANGGTPPYFWSIVGGSLPPGLFLNGGSGFIGANTGSGPGTPTAAGVYTFTVQAALFGGGATPGTADLTITIAPAPTLTTPLTLPGGASGTSYFVELSYAGGAQPVTWSNPGGGLPGGILLNDTAGVLSGIPTTPNTYTFTLAATDANGASVSGTFTLVIANGAGLVVTSTLPRGTVGVPYSGSLTAAGGTPPYTWGIVSGALPGWATFNAATGTVSGTPTAASNTAMNFSVTGGATVNSGVFNFIIDANLAITTATLPAAGVTSPYGATINATGGSGTLVWDLVSGSLPGGVTLSPTGNLGGTVSATAVTSSFQVRVTDGLGRTATRGYTITVGPAIPQGGGGSSGGGGCGGSIGLSTLPLGALASLAGLLALATRRRRKV